MTTEKVYYVATECQIETFGTIVNTMDNRCSIQPGSERSVAILNGVVCIEGLTPRSKATYLCDGHHGYYPNENMQLICQTDGEWKGITPKCQHFGERV